MEHNETNHKAFQEPTARKLTIICQYTSWVGAIIAIVIGFLFAIIPSTLAKIMFSMGLINPRFELSDIELINKPFIFLFIIIALLCYALFRIYRNKARQEKENALDVIVKKEK